jgi:hypothetical protein
MRVISPRQLLIGERELRGRIGKKLGGGGGDRKIKKGRN